MLTCTQPNANELSHPVRLSVKNYVGFGLPHSLVGQDILGVVVLDSLTKKVLGSYPSFSPVGDPEQDA